LFVQYLVFVCCLTYICIQYLALIWYGPVIKFFKTFPLQTLTELDNYELLIFIIYIHTQLKLYKWYINDKKVKGKECIHVTSFISPRLDLRWEAVVHFVEYNLIVFHHCLNFLFIISMNLEFLWYAIVYKP
jgi:hypothetical protein